MRYLLLVSLLLLSFSVHAQTIDEATVIRPGEPQTSVRGAAMGGVSYDDPALNPAVLGDTKRLFLSLSGTHLEPVNGNGLSHALVAMPLGRFVVAAHYRGNASLQGPNRLLPGGPAPYGDSGCHPFGCPMFLLSGEMFERSDRRTGVSAAWTLGKVSVGAGAELYERDESAAIAMAVMIREGNTGTVPAELIVMRISGREVVPNAGIRWKVSPRVALAAAWSGSASFSRVLEACTVGKEEPLHCASEYAPVITSTTRTPSATRASVSFQPVERLTVVGEAVRRSYDPGAEETMFFVRSWRETELRAGAEYRIRNVALRGGWWRDPAAPGVDHLTFGAGVDVGRARLELAIDDADWPAPRRAIAGVTFTSR